MNEITIRNWKILEAPEELIGHWMTGEEIGKHLGYSEPRKSIGNIYSRQQEKFKEGQDTTDISLMTVTGTKKTRIYSEKGTLKIVRYSNTEIADEIMDEVFDVFLEAKKSSNIEIPHLIKEEEATRIYASWIQVASLMNVPVHLGQIEAVKEAKRKTEVDFSPLLLKSPEQDKIAEEEMMLEPTEIGKRLEVSGIKINCFLRDIEWQAKVNSSWQPTEKGKKYSSPHSWSRGSKSGYNLKWKWVEVKKAWESKE